MGKIQNRDVKMLCDSGAVCNCVSSQFYTRYITRMTLTKLRPYHLPISTADNSPLSVMGQIRLPVKIAGLTTYHDFVVVGGLTQNVILGAGFLQHCGAVLDYNTKRLRLFNNTVDVPLTTVIDSRTALRTINRVRIPAHTETILPARVSDHSGIKYGITESLPSTLSRGLKVAGALIDGTKNVTACRVANPTSRTIVWPAGHPFAYVNPLEINATGVNLIEIPDLTNDCNKRWRDDDRPPDTKRGPGDEVSGQTRGNMRLPPHEERLRILQELGVKMGNEGLSCDQAERLSKLLLSLIHI